MYVEKEYKVSDKVFLHTDAILRKDNLCFRVHFHIDFSKEWEVTGDLDFLIFGVSFTLNGDDYAYNNKEKN